MKTRTLLLMSVGTALMILLAGGVLLFQLSGQESSTSATPIGDLARIGDAEVTVIDAELFGDTLVVSMEIGGVDDPNGIDTFRLVTGDRRLEPLAPVDDDRCSGISQAPQQCLVEFDVGASDGSSRVLVMRRGDDQATWRLA
ncbi:MAG: hypothetical protein ACI8V4_003233 [Ilumatobacter sp.]|jgi:hypothetical protein